MVLPCSWDMFDPIPTVRHFKGLSARPWWPGIMTWAPNSWTRWLWWVANGGEWWPKMGEIWGIIWMRDDECGCVGEFVVSCSFCQCRVASVYWYGSRRQTGGHPTTCCTRLAQTCAHILAIFTLRWTIVFWIWQRFKKWPHPNDWIIRRS